MKRWLRRLVERIAPEPTPAVEQPVGPPGPVAPNAVTEEPAEHELQALLDRMRLEPAADQASQLDPLLALVDRIGETRGPRRGLELLERAAEQLPGLLELRLALAERLADAQRLQTALPWLEQLVEAPEPVERRALVARAHLLLGDYHQREADLRRAAQHYEAVLARDFSNRRARARADALREQLEQPAGSAAATVIGPDDARAGGRYLIERALGQGGAGNVYLAHDRQLQRAVALKVLHPQVARQPQARARLFCEARIAASLHHPSIITVYDLDEALNLVVMEYCAGATLAERLARAPLDPPLALGWLAEIAAALDTVHRCGVVHRDLKPKNLLLRGPRGPLVLTDFGVAHAPTDDGAPGVAGSRAYMPPEQRRGEAPDPRSDLYALGVILLDMLLGTPCIPPEAALLGATPHDTPELWQRLARMEGPATAATVELARRLVAPDAGGRPATASQVAHEALAQAAAWRAHGDAVAARAELLRRAEGVIDDRACQAWMRTADIAGLR